jgi:hypothetical protein
MGKEKTLVSETILQLKNLEDVVTENAKGILASTMKEEIKELVKESLIEAEDDEIDDEENIDINFDDEDDETEGDMDDMEDVEDEEDEDDEDGMGFDDSEEAIDLTTSSNSDALRVFKLLGPEDQIIVTKDSSGNINVKDNETNKEYMIVAESDEDYYSDEFEEEELDEESYFGDEGDDDDDFNTPPSLKKFNYDIPELSPISPEEMEFGAEDEGDEYSSKDVDIFSRRRGSDIESDEDEDGDDDLEESIYEITFGKDEMDEGDDYELGEDDEFEEDYNLDEDDYEFEEGMEFGDEMDEEDEDDDFSRIFDEDSIMEAKKMRKGFKAKGVGMGSPNVKVYHDKPNMGKGFKTDMKQGPRAVGTGKAKFEYKESKDVKPKKAETKEASRTLGSGSKFRKGGLPKQRAHSKFNANIKSTIKEDINNAEIQILKDKNIELRNALNIFRDKLNEVAVFNSNLAYATRLFTEHSTSKQEKINILKRFDGVETLKESKNLYKSIKDELSSTKKQMNESIERKIEKVQSTGSAVNLIESKTYENPQFLRMKDLMQKIK